MVFSDPIWRYCPDTGRSTGAYIVFNKGGPLDHCTNVTGTVAQYSAEIEYNSVCTVGMDLSYLRMLNNEFLNKDPDMVP